MASDSIERLVSRDTLCLFYCPCSTARAGRSAGRGDMLVVEICWSWQSFVGGRNFWRSTRWHWAGAETHFVVKI